MGHGGRMISIGPQGFCETLESFSPESSTTQERQPLHRLRCLRECGLLPQPLFGLVLVILGRRRLGF